MKNENLVRMDYESPWCRDLRIDSENVLCTSSVGDGYNSTTEDVIIKDLEW